MAVPAPFSFFLCSRVIFWTRPHGVGMGLAWGWHGVGMGLAWGWHGAAWGRMGLAWGRMGLAWCRMGRVGMGGMGPHDWG
jgi:hypothetical protein